MLPNELTERAAAVGSLLRDREETIGVSESSTGGLISASLLSVGGASAYFLGGAVVYTMDARRAFLRGEVEAPDGMRGASEEFAGYEAQSVRLKLQTTWGLGETGATGPTGNGYGDPAGHAWFAVVGADEERTRNLLTGGSDRQANMVAFAAAALDLLAEALR